MELGLIEAGVNDQKSNELECDNELCVGLLQSMMAMLEGHKIFQEVEFNVVSGADVTFCHIFYFCVKKIKAPALI